MNQITLTLSITPVIEFDDLSKLYWGYFKEFPEGISTAPTEEEVAKRLFNLLTLMIKNEPSTTAKIIENGKIEVVDLEALRRANN